MCTGIVLIWVSGLYWYGYQYGSVLILVWVLVLYRYRDCIDMVISMGIGMGIIMGLYLYGYQYGNWDDYTGLPWGSASTWRKNHKMSALQMERGGLELLLVGSHLGETGSQTGSGTGFSRRLDRTRSETGFLRSLDQTRSLTDFSNRLDKTRLLKSFSNRLDKTLFQFKKNGYL